MLRNRTSNRQWRAALSCCSLAILLLASRAGAIEGEKIAAGPSAPRIVDSHADPAGASSATRREAAQGEPELFESTDRETARGEADALRP